MNLMHLLQIDRITVSYFQTMFGDWEGCVVSGRYLFVMLDTSNLTQHTAILDT